jgi:hypothetical protein
MRMLKNMVPITIIVIFGLSPIPSQSSMTGVKALAGM